MLFYQKIFGGALVLQTIGDTPFSKKMPAKMKKYILHATLKNKAFVITGSDITNENGLKKGNTVSLMFTCRNKKEIIDYYKKLSRGGVQTYPPDITFYGNWFGSLTDKYGHQWLLSCDGDV